MNDKKKDSLIQEGQQLARTDSPTILVPSSTSVFNYSKQNPAVHALTGMKKSATNYDIDVIANSATISSSALKIFSSPAAILDDLRDTTSQLLWALLSVCTRNGFKSPEVVMSLSEYMEKRGLTSEKATLRQVKIDLETLFNMRISFSGTSGFTDIRIIEAKGITNGLIYVKFGNTFFNRLLPYPAAPYPALLLSINSHSNPGAMWLLEKCNNHKYLNNGKRNENIISVRSLLKDNPNYPTYEEIRKSKGRNLSQRLIDPFERDMNALNEAFSWEYCDKNGTPLSDKELKAAPSYRSFSTLFTLLTWHNYPKLERKKAVKHHAKSCKSEA